MRLADLAAALVIVLAGAACETSVRGIALGPLDGNTVCEEANTHSDLAYIEGSIFKRHCAFSGCHSTEDPLSANLQLTDGTSHAELVGVDAQSQIAVMNPHGNGDKWKRVVAGDLQDSYLLVLIDPLTNPQNPELTDPTGFAGPIDPKIGAMPENSELICSQEVEAIKRWIMAGAPEQ